MKEIKLSDKQIEIIENIQLEKKESEKRIKELYDQSLIVMRLIFDFHGVDMPQEVAYKNGSIKWEEEKISK